VIAAGMDNTADNTAGMDNTGGATTPGQVASSCPTCLAWGVLYGGYCRACYDFRRRHPSAHCAGCRRDTPLKNGYCRLCWLQAAVQAQNPPAVTDTDLAAVTCHQLWFAGTTKMRGPRSRLPRRLRVLALAADLAPPTTPGLPTAGSCSCTCPDPRGPSTGPSTPSSPIPPSPVSAGSPRRWARPAAGTPS
jgi:hypothetical protein